MTTALITGASSGIGRELARVYAQHGHDLVLVARSEQKLRDLKESLTQEYGIVVRLFFKDLSRDEAPLEIHTALQMEGVDVELLINNAGIGEFGLFHQSDWEDAAAIIDLNVKAVAHLTRLFSADMVARGSGRIMNVASTAAFQPGPLMSIYYASKSFVLSFSEAIAQELHGYGVTVTALCPGPTRSNFHARANMQESGLVTLYPLPSSRDVATYGYKAMMNGKRVAVHGWLNKILYRAVRIAPRNWTTAVVRKFQEKR